MRRRKKRIVSSLLLFAVLIIGLSLLLYPSLSDYWNSIYQSRAVAEYSEEIANLNEKEYAEQWQKAEQYNESLTTRINRYSLSDEQRAQYPSMLRVGNTEVLGYVEIPSIDVVLPIYHGTDEIVLQTAVGHLDWTSLPIGGESTHSVISGHRGLPSAKLFSDLDELIVGDIFMIRVLDKTLTYEVDQINIVEPTQVTDLAIQDGQDLCTLVTCTPYGVNTHRLLVRGHRVENRAEAKNVRLTSEATQIEPLIVAPLVAIPMLIVLMVIVLFKDEKKRKTQAGRDSNG